MNVFNDVYDFYSRFNSEKFSIGNSFFGLPLWCFAVRKTEHPKVIFQYSIHAREFITTYLALEQIKEYLEFGNVGTAYFIPLVNPDGVDIATHSNPLYKANGRGVDLNVNFDARWGKGRKNKKEKGNSDYIGEKPFSEPETKALRDFTLKICPNFTVSYHAKGEEIYYEFHQKKPDIIRDKEIAFAVAKTTGYKIRKTPFSSGGYKDWCIDKLKIPSLTIEVGDDNLSHPIGLSSLGYIYEKNKGVVNTVMQTLTEIL